VLAFFKWLIGLLWDGSLTVTSVLAEATASISPPSGISVKGESRLEANPATMPGMPPRANVA